MATDPHALFAYRDRVWIEGCPARVTDINVRGEVTVQLLDGGDDD